jgi:hypothetical protein
MKRALLLTTLVTLAIAAPAQAHTLSIPYARGAAAYGARQLVAQQGGGWYTVDRCYRATAHVVYCSVVVTLIKPYGNLNCGVVIKIWISGRSYQRYWNDVRAHCSPPV